MHPLKNLDPAPDRSRGLGQRLAFRMAGSLLCEPARDRAGKGDGLIRRVGMGAPTAAPTLPPRRGVSLDPGSMAKHG